MIIEWYLQFEKYLGKIQGALENVFGTAVKVSLTLDSKKADAIVIQFASQFYQDKLALPLDKLDLPKEGLACYFRTILLLNDSEIPS